METFFILAPLLVGIIALGYVIAANLLRVWLKHRLKLALLEKLQHDPSHGETLEELQALLDESASTTGGSVRVDYRILGVTLAALGLLSLLAAWLFGEPEWMTGLYFGGVICLAAGFILALLGLVVRYVERIVAEPLHKM
ncbi:MAG: hypothetical protein JNK74_06485 [Candidatus Hydrogenedentes bacterium]|nr:hypothetical protein [Candidatus Hydrogenedentota bacterium]